MEPLPLARSVVDPGAHRRGEPDLLASLWRDPATQVLVVHDARLPLAEEEAALALRTPAELAALAGGDGPDLAAGGVVWVYLGSCEQRPYLAALVTGDGPAGPVVQGVAERWGLLREVGHALSDRDADLATTAVALAEWHARHPHCSRCGARTRPALAGWVRRCPDDAAEEYPRTDAAVIMAVTDDDDRILLAHAARWSPHRYSTLAGFVEPGEALETAVRREVLEETGVVVDRVDYVASQPWPFPASLMVGFRAHAATTAVAADGAEVADARWFTREELTAALASGSVVLPMRTSIALALIEDWYGGPLPASTAWRSS